MAAVRAGVTSIEHGSMLTTKSIASMKQHGTYLVPTSIFGTDQPRGIAAAVRRNGRVGR